MNKNKLLTRIFAVFVLVLFSSSLVLAQPTGTDITHIGTDTVIGSSPDIRTDDGGTITTLVVDALQQNPNWKAYVGNITGSLTLDDADGNTIFNWVLDQSSISGNIYSSRNNAIDWGDITCADGAIISSEETFLGLSATAADSISNTFNETTHPSLSVNQGTHSSCPATSTFVNNDRQDQGSADFPIVLLKDTTDLIYVTPISAATIGYDGASLFDFQLIMANNPSDTTSYYFYVELTGG